MKKALLLIVSVLVLLGLVSAWWLSIPAPTDISESETGNRLFADRSNKVILNVQGYLIPLLVSGSSLYGIPPAYESQETINFFDFGAVAYLDNGTFQYKVPKQMLLELARRGSEVATIKFVPVHSWHASPAGVGDDVGELFGRGLPPSEGEAVSIREGTFVDFTSWSIFFTKPWAPVLYEVHLVYPEN